MHSKYAKLPREVEGGWSQKVKEVEVSDCRKNTYTYRKWSTEVYRYASVLCSSTIPAQNKQATAGQQAMNPSAVVVFPCR